MTVLSAVVRKREPWGRFALKVAITLLCIVAVGAAFTSRYHFGLDSQELSCFEDKRFFLVDRDDTTLHRDRIYAFSSRGMLPFFEDGTQVVKILRGMPGDHIEITHEGAVLINGEEVAHGLPLARHLDQVPDNFVGEAILPDDTYWFMGETASSFDSRYWGTVTKEQIIGRAYPIF